MPHVFEAQHAYFEISPLKVVYIRALINKYDIQTKKYRVPGVRLGSPIQTKECLADQKNLLQALVIVLSSIFGSL